MNKALVAESLNVDLVTGVPRFPTLQGARFQEHVGGGANQALGLQNVPTSMWGCVGDDAYGCSIPGALEFLSIESHVTIFNSNMGLAFIKRSAEAQNPMVIVPGINALFSKEHIGQSLGLLSQQDILVLQYEIPLETADKR